MERRLQDRFSHNSTSSKINFNEFTSPIQESSDCRRPEWALHSAFTTLSTGYDASFVYLYNELYILVPMEEGVFGREEETGYSAIACQVR